jgi:hypothetical protein
MSEPDGQLGVLRGAAVDVDARRVARLLVAVALAALAALIAVLVAAGVTKNDQIEELRSQGIALRASVLSCRSLLGGSGSNGVGYACVGAYRVGGRRYVKSLPFSTFLAPGSSVRVVVASSDPGLLTSPARLAAEHASWRVFAVPGVLAMVLAALLGALARRRAAGRALRRG